MYLHIAGFKLQTVVMDGGRRYSPKTMEPQEQKGTVTTLNEYIQLYVHVSVVISPRACGVEGEMRDTINVSVMEKVLSLDSSPVVKGFHRVQNPVRS